MLNDRNRLILKCLIFIFCFSLIIHRWQQISIFDEGYGKSWFYGDAFSGRNVYSSAQFFKDSGFTKTSFLPMFDYKRVDRKQEEGYPLHVYTHYPPLPDILAGFYMTAFGTTNRHTIAIVPLLLSLMMFFLIYRFLEDLLKHKNIAFISASLLVLSNYYIAWADDTHQHVYTEFFKWLMFYLLYHYYENNRTPFYYIPIIAVIYVMQSNFSFEPIVFIAIVILGFSYIYKKSIFTREVFILLPMPLIGFGLHMLQNYYYLGSWSKVYEDMQQAFLIRTQGVGPEVPADHVVNFRNIKRHIPIWMSRVGHYFLIPFSLLVPLSVLGLRKMRKENKKLFQITIVFLIAGLNWYFVMTQHAFVHMFTTRHLAFFYALVIGYGLYEYRRIFLQHWYDKKIGWMILHFTLIYYGILIFTVNHFYYLYIKYGFAYPYFGTDDFQWGRFADYII
jgi:hypothetical protein